MIRKSTFTATRNLSIALVCVLLAACATTQRSNSGAGNEGAAPAAEATVAKAAPAAAAAATTEPTAQSAAPAASKSAAKADESGPMVFPNTNNDTPDAKEVADQKEEVKRQLDQQDAEIDKIHQAQDTEANKMEQETAAAQASQETPVTDQPSKPRVRAKKPRAEEEAVVFPATHDTAEPAVTKALDHSVYFNYDEATVLDIYDTMLLANAAYIKAHPDLSVEVQGNCDERGSSEYNLALGARRAEQVKRALEVGGVGDSRIHTVSFGKEKPIAMGQDETSYSKNRRADIVF